MASLSAAAIGVRKVFLAKIKPGADGTIKKNNDMYESLAATAFSTEELIEKAQTPWRPGRRAAQGDHPHPGTQVVAEPGRDDRQSLPFRVASQAEKEVGAR